MSVYEKPIVEDAFVGPEAPAPALSEAPGAAAMPDVSAAMERFKSCRWRKAAENGTPDCCGHRDVLPLTGANGFDAEAWCPSCEFYKLRRTPKKRDYYNDRY